MLLDPGNSNVMMGADILKKTTDALNDGLIAPEEVNYFRWYFSIPERYHSETLDSKVKRPFVK